MATAAVSVSDLKQGEPARLVTIESILALHHSIDTGYMFEQGRNGQGRPWIETCQDKKDDQHYEALVESMKTRGQVTPVTVKEEYIHWSSEEMRMIFGDGHHRLLAAIELGWTEILCAFPIADDWAGLVSPISGSWSKDGDEEREDKYGWSERQYREKLLSGGLEKTR